MALAEEGADVALQFNRGKESADSAAAQVRKLGRRGLAVQTDVSDASACRRFGDANIRSLGRDCLLRCLAGHPFRREEWDQPFPELTPDEIQRPTAIDLFGSVFIAR